MNTNPKNNPEEVDIIQFFSAIGNMFKGLFNGIIHLFKYLFYAMIDILLYLKKYYVYWIIGMILGLIVSFLIPAKQLTYYGKAMLRTNYRSQISLKEKLDLINDYIQKGDSLQLSKLLSISPKQAAQLSSFTIEPVLNDIFLIDDYEEFLMIKDTVVYKFLDYKNYKANIKNNESLNKYWLLTVKVKEPQALNGINDKLLALFNDDEALEKRKENYLKALTLRYQKDYKSLKDIDSMRQVFNQVMIDLAQNKSNGAANIVVSSDRVSGPEASYNLFFERQKLLTDIEKLSHKFNKYDDVIVMINALPPSGIKEQSIIGNIHTKYALLGFMLALLILLAKDFNNYLKTYEQRKKASQ